MVTKLDSDARLICSLAYLKKEAYGLDTEAVALGTQMKKQLYWTISCVEAPRYHIAKAEGAEQLLTDHNEFQQSNFRVEVEVWCGVVDHHRVANFEAASPLYMRLEPVGSASSIRTPHVQKNTV